MSLIERLRMIVGTQFTPTETALVLEAATQLEAMQAEIERLRETVSEAREALSLGAAIPMIDPRCSVEVTALCDTFGYGAVMSTASALWRELLMSDGLQGGEFCAGPCRGTAESVIAQIDASLSQEQQHG